MQTEERPGLIGRGMNRDEMRMMVEVSVGEVEMSGISARRDVLTRGLSGLFSVERTENCLA